MIIIASNTSKPIGPNACHATTLSVEVPEGGGVGAFGRGFLDRIGGVSSTTPSGQLPEREKESPGM
jgi:hypothetical protein